MFIKKKERQNNDYLGWLNNVNRGVEMFTFAQVKIHRCKNKRRTGQKTGIAELWKKYVGRENCFRSSLLFQHCHFQFIWGGYDILQNSSVFYYYCGCIFVYSLVG